MSRKFAIVLSGSLLCFSLAVPVVAACLTDQEVELLVVAYTNKVPAPNPPDMTIADAECSRDKLNTSLQATLGPIAGYKAGLTNPAVQQRFNHNAPVRGTLYVSMLLENGASVPTAFGARPLFEADLLVRVSNAAINQARTPREVLASIDQIVPFIELPDLLVAEPGKLNGAAIIAINVGARLGVTGKPLPISPDGNLESRLRDMRVIVRGNGVELDSGLGSDVLEQPLNAVVWLVADLARAGLALKPGDLVSLGSFSRLLQPEAGLAVAVQYLGLPGDPTVEFRFQ